MRTILQVEYQSGLLTVRAEILQSLGYPVLSRSLGHGWASLDLSDNDVGVILIGRGAPCAETGEQITVSCISRETRPERILVSPNDSIGPVPPLRQVHPRP